MSRRWTCCGCRLALLARWQRRSQPPLAVLLPSRCVSSPTPSPRPRHRNCSSGKLPPPAFKRSHRRMRSRRVDDPPCPSPARPASVGFIGLAAGGSTSAGPLQPPAVVSGRPPRPRRDAPSAVLAAPLPSGDALASRHASPASRRARATTTVAARPLDGPRWHRHVAWREAISGDGNGSRSSRRQTISLPATRTRPPTSFQGSPRLDPAGAVHRRSPAAVPLPPPSPASLPTSILAFTVWSPSRRAPSACSPTTGRAV
jgi:hypothetical protein